MYIHLARSFHAQFEFDKMVNKNEVKMRTKIEKVNVFNTQKKKKHFQ